MTVKPMTKTQSEALAAVAKWGRETIKGTPDHWRAKIAGTMIMTVLPLTNDQLIMIDEIINQ